MNMAWMLGAAAAGVLLGCAGLAGERIAAWFRLPRRWIWAAAMAASLLLPFVALAAPGVLPRFHLPSAPPPHAPQPQPAAAVASPSPAAQEPTRGAASRGLPAGVLAGWLAASLAIAAAFALSQRRLRAECGALEPRRLAGEHVFVADRAGPMVLGVIAPRIVLPRWVADGPGDELRLIVRHEREHVRAGDPWLLAASALAVAAIPWSAVLWWMHRRLRLAVETDCDARVLARGESVERYGRVLLRTASRGSFLAAGALGLGGRWTHLERRILAMTARPPRRALARAVPMAGLACAAVAAACGVASTGSRAPEPEPPAATDEMFDGRIAKEFPLDATLVLTILGPNPREGTVGLNWRYGDEQRTRNSPPPNELPTVTRVQPGSPAERAGLRVGDVIVTSNGNDARMPFLFGEKRPGAVHTLRIRRGGAERAVRLVVGPPPSRAEIERHMEETAACERRVHLEGRDRPSMSGRLDACYFPY